VEEGEKWITKVCAQKSHEVMLNVARNRREQ